MRQNWIIGNLDKQECISPLDFDEKGLLTAWYNIGSYTSSKFMEMLGFLWKGDNVVIVGDKTTRLYNGNNLYNVCNSFKHLTKYPLHTFTYVYNHNRKFFFDLLKIKKDKYLPNINPLVLLLAGEENGDYEGDYVGDNMGLIGSWISDVNNIEVTNNLLPLNYQQIAFSIEED